MMTSDPILLPAIQDKRKRNGSMQTTITKETRSANMHTKESYEQKRKENQRGRLLLRRLQRTRKQIQRNIDTRLYKEGKQGSR